MFFLLNRLSGSIPNGWGDSVFRIVSLLDWEKALVADFLPMYIVGLDPRPPKLLDGGKGVGVTIRR